MVISIGSPAEIQIGEVAYRNMHTMWKRGCRLAELPENWPYHFEDGRPYPVHTFAAEGPIGVPAGAVEGV